MWQLKIRTVYYSQRQVPIFNNKQTWKYENNEEKPRMGILR